METSCKRNQVENLFPQLIEIKYMHDIYWEKIGLKNWIIRMAPVADCPKNESDLSANFMEQPFWFNKIYNIYFIIQLFVFIAWSYLPLKYCSFYNGRGKKKKKLKHSQLLLKLLFDRLSPFGRLILTFFLTTFNFTLLPLFGFGVFSI